MTMQVGMVGSDGIVLASDTTWIAAPQQGIRQTSSSTKIKVSEGRGVAISFARNMETSGRIADDIIANLSDEKWQYPIFPMQEIARNVLRSAGCRNDAQCLIVTANPRRLFVMRTATINQQPGVPQCGEVNDKAVIGDDANAAIYWSEAYYERLRPVRVLVPVAAQVVIAAAKFNSGTIGGLEVVLCDDAGFHRLSNASIRELEAKANERDRAMRTSFATQGQEFSYAPNVVG